MTSGSQSKAQRRTENQRRAEERRRAEKRKKQMRFGLWGLGGLVAIVLVVVLVLALTSSSNSVPPSAKNPHVPLQAIPASMKSSWIQPPAGTPGPETVAIPSGPKLATLINAATGQTVDGVSCQAGEQTVVHVHTHLTIFVNGKQQVIPYGIGIPGFQAATSRANPSSRPGAASTGCTCMPRTASSTSSRRAHQPRTSLGQFFDEWGQPLSTNQVGPATGKVTVFFTSPGKQPALYTGDPHDLPLGDHYQIQLDVGTPIVAPYQVKSWGGL